MMSFIDDVFEGYSPDTDLLAPAGFIHDGKDRVLHGEILFGHFNVALRISPQGRLHLTLCDSNGEEYALIHVESARGDFVEHVRDACCAWLTEVRDKCFVKRLFISDQAAWLAAILRHRYGDTQDDPWNGRYLGHVVFRKKDSRKWYALTMNIDGKHMGCPGTRRDVLAVRAGEKRVPLLLSQKGFLPAYHMNRASWVMIPLDGSMGDDELLAELEAARTLLAGEIKSDPSAWLVPANPKYFDLEAAFKKDKTILWKQSTAIRAGDTVYLYVTAPISAISYQCRVLETDIPYEYQDKNVRMDHVMKIQLKRRFPPEKFPLKALGKYGVNAVRGPRRMPSALLKAIGKKRNEQIGGHRK